MKINSLPTNKKVESTKNVTMVLISFRVNESEIGVNLTTSGHGQGQFKIKSSKLMKNRLSHGILGFFWVAISESSVSLTPSVHGQGQFKIIGVN